MLIDCPNDSEPVPAEMRQQLLDPIIAATCEAVGEMAGIHPAVRNLYRQPVSHPIGDVIAVLAIKTGAKGALHVCFPRATAAALAARILTGVAQQIDDSLLRDCVGEIGNVISGQSKALLAESRFPWVFAMPPIVMDADQMQDESEHAAYVAVLACEAGSFAIQLSIDDSKLVPAGLTTPT
jgi:CheY-specific phosphatase CheX